MNMSTEMTSSVQEFAEHSRNLADVAAIADQYLEENRLLKETIQDLQGEAMVLRNKAAAYATRLVELAFASVKDKASPSAPPHPKFNLFKPNCEFVEVKQTEDEIVLYLRAGYGYFEVCRVNRDDPEDVDHLLYMRQMLVRSIEFIQMDAYP